MRNFDLLEPDSLQSACEMLRHHEDAKAIAGGTALLTIIKQGLLAPNVLINLHKIRDGRQIDFDPQGNLRIGALACIQEIENSALVREHFPFLADACHVVANIRIRNMATIGGNLAHGDYQSDPPTVLSALDCEVELLGSRGTRELALEDFLLGSYDTALQPGELVSAIKLKPMPRDAQTVYIKFTTGSSEERPCAGVAALVRSDGGLCRELRLAIGAVSSKPIRVRAGEALARDQELAAPLIDSIAAEAARTVDPIDDIRGPAEYKRHLVAVLTRRAINACLHGGAGKKTT